MSPVLYPFHTVGIEALAIEHFLEASEPTAVDGVALVGSGILVFLHVDVELRADIEQRRDALTELQRALSFLGSLTDVVVHPLVERAEEVGDIILGIVLTEKQHVEHASFAVFIEEVGYFTTQQYGGQYLAFLECRH